MAVFVLLGLAQFAAWLGEAERRVAVTESETVLAALALETERSVHET